MTNKIILYGSTGHALAVREQINRVFAHRGHDIVAYIDDYRAAENARVDGVPVIGFEQWRDEFRDIPVIITVGDPRSRRKLAAKIEAAGGIFASMVGDWPSIAGDFRHGEGCFTGGPNYIGPNVRIGQHVQVQPMAALGHDSKVGDFTTICSSNIAGWVIIEEEVFIGIGVAIVHGTEARPIRIGRGAYVCAGAVVTKSVPPGTKVAGNPARDVSLAALRKRRWIASPSARDDVRAQGSVNGIRQIKE